MTRIPSVSDLTHNELADLRAVIDLTLAERARDLIGQTVHVPDWLLADDTPPERRVAKVHRVNRTKGTLPNVSIVPGGAYGGASVSLVDVRTVEGPCTDGRHRPDDDPEPGDRCKDCGQSLTWRGPGPYDWDLA